MLGLPTTAAQNLQQQNLHQDGAGGFVQRGRDAEAATSSDSPRTTPGSKPSGGGSAGKGGGAGTNGTNGKPGGTPGGGKGGGAGGAKDQQRENGGSRYGPHGYGSPAANQNHGGGKGDANGKNGHHGRGKTGAIGGKDSTINKISHTRLDVGNACVYYLLSRFVLVIGLSPSIVFC